MSQANPSRTAGRNVRRRAGASLATYRRAVSSGQDSTQWAALAANLASAVDRLLAVLDEDDNQLSAAWTAISELRARVDQDSRRLDSYDKAWAVLGIESSSATQQPAALQRRIHDSEHAKLTLIRGGNH